MEKGGGANAREMPVLRMTGSITEGEPTRVSREAPRRWWLGEAREGGGEGQHVGAVCPCPLWWAIVPAGCRKGMCGCRAARERMYF